MKSAIYGVLAEPAGSGSTPAYLLGGLFLLQQKAIRWHIPVAR